ncbi:MAG: cation:proton antiporter [Legionellaceae bacterium]|nr:cation:proton antiporter [Legionellaceae bacterium]|tara:strand:- start:1855 stop:2214 length:360 start_codon:yes stop_codon:yes gene_type:complete
MEVLLCWLVGILVAISIYLMLNRNLIRILFGIMIISTAINLLIFAVGRVTFVVPAFIEEGRDIAPKVFANAVPQALILTAIVIGFGVVTYTLILITKVWQDSDTMNIDEIRLAEPKDNA